MFWMGLLSFSGDFRIFFFQFQGSQEDLWRVLKEVEAGFKGLQDVLWRFRKSGVL